MAKGEGGGGHFDERRRAKKASTGYADSPEVLSVITKPRKKPVVVVKKKKTVPIPQAKPSRVQTDSDSGDVPEPPTRMVTTRYNVGGNLRSGAKAADARDQSFKPATVADYLKRRLSPKAGPYANRRRKDDFDGGIFHADTSVDRLGPGSEIPYSPASPVAEDDHASFANYSPGAGLFGYEGMKLLNWVKRRNAVRGPRNI